MIKHILKLIWNRRKSYTIIFVEQILVAIILMLCVVTVVTAIKKYNDPGILSVDNTISFGYMVPGGGNDREKTEELKRNMETICLKLAKLPYVKAISQGSYLTPYLRPTESYWSDSITVDNRKILTFIKGTDQYGEIVYQPIMEKGKWISGQKREDGTVEALITRQFMDKVGWQDAIGKKITIGPMQCTIVGVVEGAKQQPFELSPVAIILPVEITCGPRSKEYTARIDKGYKAAFCDALYKEFKRLNHQINAELIINDVSLWKQTSMLGILLLIVFQSLPTFFLVIFAFIGTFGLIWMHATRRTKEFALRLALGSTPGLLIKIVLGESLFIALFATIPAWILFLFIYPFDLIHFLSMGFVCLIMVLFSLISAWYPAWIVSRIHPAEALQYE